MLYSDLIEKWLNDGEGEGLDIPRWRIAKDIEDLNSPLRRDNLAHWYALGLEEALHWHGMWSTQKLDSVEDLKARVEDSRRGAAYGYDAVPWAKSDVETIEAWFRLTPFQMYMLIREFRSHMLSRLEDEMANLLSGKAADETRYAEEAWAGVITVWLQGLKG